MAIKILIAEDEMLLVQAYQAFLTHHLDVQLQLSHTGQDAVALIQKTPPDIIFLDWHLPLGGGEAVLRHLRQERLNIPCVIISGVTAQIEDRWLQLPNIRYVLNKPFALSSFVTIIKDCLPQQHHSAMFYKQAEGNT